MIKVFVLIGVLFLAGCHTGIRVTDPYERGFNDGVRFMTIIERGDYDE